MNASKVARRSGADLLVEGLVRHGIEVVFGVPGDTSVALYDVLARRTNDIRHILARDERHSAYMADAYARTTRRVAACEASSGAGATYLSSGLGEAYASSIPVLVITTDIRRSSRGSGAITEIRQDLLFAAVTKWCRTADSALSVPSLIAEAVTQATSGRPGPAALIVPEDVLDEYAEASVPAGSSQVPAERLAAEPESLETAAALLRDASRPAVLAGGGVHASGGWSHLRALAEHAAIPVATTIHGKSAFPEDHPLALGVAGGNGSRGYSNAYLAKSDAVLIVGSRANSTDTDGFAAPPQVAARSVIHIEIDGDRAGRNFPGSITLVGDAATVLDQLRTALPPADPTIRRIREDAIAGERQAWERDSSHASSDVGAGVLAPQEVVRLLHRILGPSAWVTADAGTPTPYLAAFWDTDGCGWRLVIPRGHGAMGYSIPAAIGVAIAHPEDRVLCLTTESSLAMAVGEWETAARLDLPITYLVLDNVSFAWIKMLQHLYMGGRYFGVDPGPIDPVLLARGMGLAAAKATSLGELENLVERSANAGGPSVIHVPVPEHAHCVPPVSAWQAALVDPSPSRPAY